MRDIQSTDDVLKAVDKLPHHKRMQFAGKIGRTAPAEKLKTIIEDLLRPPQYVAIDVEYDDYVFPAQQSSSDSVSSKQVNNFGKLQEKVYWGLVD